MAGSYTTGSDELKRAAQQMENTKEQLMKNLSTLAGEVEQVASSWSGQAHTAFQTLMERFQTDAQQLNQSLDTIAEAVTGSATAYAQQEEEASQSLSAITNALNG